MAGDPSPSPSYPPPSPYDFPHDDTVPVDAELSPRCVKAGETMALTVITKPNNAYLAYHAVYSGDESGAEPPYGEGHGGNGEGEIPPGGHYETTWVVSPDAPSGPARVDVVVAWNGEWGYEAPTFAVAKRDTGDCPADWIDESEEGGD